MKITKKIFGEFDGKEVYEFTFTNEKGNGVSIINYGATVTSWLVKNKNIVAGFDNLSDYINNGAYFGCVVGRYANRIANGTFKIDGNLFTLARNNGSNHLHGGLKGFDKINWDATINDTAKIPVLSLHYLSKDGEEGYPGNLNVRVDYNYTEDDELIIEYCAETDKATPVNFTSHCYFNLTGDMDQSILDHALIINADNYTPVDENQIPTGELKAVEATPFDFRKPVIIANNMDKIPGGLDHNFVLNKIGNEFSAAATLTAPGNDINLSVFTTEPAMQLYTGNFLDGSSNNRDDKSINKQSALCLETQHFPDSPNQSHFPSTILQPGQKFYSKTVYKAE